jgi:hypothetical protein
MRGHFRQAFLCIFGGHVMPVVQGFRVAGLFGLWGMMIAVASAAPQGLPGPIAVPGAPAMQLQGGKGIGPLVSALATGGIHGQQLAAMIRAFQAAKGIGQGHVGKMGGGKGGLGGAGPFGPEKAGKGGKGEQAFPGVGHPGMVPLPNLGGQQAKPGGKLPVPGGVPADPGKAIPGGKLPPGRAQPGFVPPFGPGGKQILPGGGPFGKGKGGQGGQILPGGDKQGVLPPFVPGGKGGFGGGGLFGKGKGKK